MVKITIKYIILSFALLSNIAMAKEKILITRLKSVQFEVMASEIKKQLSDDFDIKERIIDNDVSTKEFSQFVSKQKPKLHITLGDFPLNMLKQFKKESQDQTPSIALMGLDFHKKITSEISKKYNIAAISFETPGFTIVQNFQRLVNTKLKQVHVFYRSSKDKEKIIKQERFLKKIKIELVKHDVEGQGQSNENIAEFLENKLVNLSELKSKTPIVVWVPLDSLILNNNNFNKIWHPIAKNNKIAFLSGVKKLASPRLNFCTFSMSPSIKGLSSQVTEMVYSILKQGIFAHEIGVEQVLTSSKYLNLNKGKKIGLIYNENRLQSVEVLE